MMTVESVSRAELAKYAEKWPRVQALVKFSKWGLSGSANG